jgi:hypothetical protein
LQHFWAITKKCEIIGKFQICQVWNWHQSNQSMFIIYDSKVKLMYQWK